MGVPRTVHTTVTGGVPGYRAVTAIAHLGEAPLPRPRDGTLVLTPSCTSGLLQLADGMYRLFTSVVTTAERRPERAALLELPSRMPMDEPPASAPALLGDVLVEAGAADREDIALAVLEQSIEPDGRPIGQILVDHGQVAPGEITLALETQATRRTVADGSIRVDVDLLDLLVRQVGELVLTCDQIVRHSGGPCDLRLRRALRQLNLIAGLLQEGVATTRMQPGAHGRTRLTSVRLGWRARTPRSRG